MLSLFRVCFTKLHNPDCTLLVYFLFRTISSPEDRQSCPQQIHTPHQSFERATDCWLAGRQADWPQTHPPSPVAAASCCFTWLSSNKSFLRLVGSFRGEGTTHRFLESLSQLRTETHRHSRTHTHRQTLCWGICLTGCCCSLSSRIFSSLVSSYFTCAISTTTTCRSLFSNI